MICINRRQFARLMGGATLAVPLVPGLGGDTDEKSPHVAIPEQEPGVPKPESKLSLSPEQEERVKQAVERRNRQLAALRSRTLPYDLEPAFTFRVRKREAAKQGSKEVRR